MLDWVEKLPTWSAFLGYVVLWALVATLVTSLLRRSLGHFTAAKRTAWSEVLALSLPRPAGYAVFLMALTAGLRFLPENERRLTELHRLLATAPAVLGVMVLMRVASRSIDAYGKSNPELASSAGVGKAVAWVVGLALMAVLVSDGLGISLAPALTALGVGSLAVGLGLQDTLSNFFSGLYLVVDKPVGRGDFIRIDPNYEGYVDSIGWRSTHLRTLANNLVVIPNATLSKAVITNYSRPTPQIAASVRIDVATDADIDRVEEVIGDEAKRAAAGVPGVSDSPAPSVALSPGFIDGGIGFTVAFEVKSFADQGNAQNMMRKLIVRRLQKEGIAPYSPAPGKVR